LVDTKLDPIKQSDDEITGQRLSQFGIEVIKEMNRLGLLIDITHISDGLQREALQISKAPVMASHSCVRALNNIPRNVPDNILKLIKKNGGAIMVQFSSLYLSPEYYQKYQAIRENYLIIRQSLYKKYADDKQTLFQRLLEHDVKYRTPAVDIELLLDHIDHAVKIAGIDHVGLGSDFIREVNARGLEDPEGYVLITYNLLKRGYSEENIKKILGENLLRILQEVQDIALSGLNP
jgi:membrane dipeptidase